MELELPQVLLGGIAPEAVLAAAALSLLVVDAFVPKSASRWYLAVGATVALVASGGLAAAAWDTNQLQLAGMVAADNFSVFAKSAVAVFGLLTVWLGRDYLVEHGEEEAEFYALVLFAGAGMMLMTAAADLIMMFVALETFSIALYVLVAARRHAVAQESAMKYFLLGAFSSAFFLLGIALVYGAVGSTNLYGTSAAPGIVTFLATAPASEFGLLVLATGLLVVGLGFKVAAVPFHMWTPDAYQGAQSPIAGFMASATKIAGFAALLRLLDVALLRLAWDWRPVTIAIAIATMVTGSILAVVQEDVKRMLAYSSIAHAGFVLTGVIAASDRGVAASLFYLVTYGLTVLGAFAVVAVLGGRNETRVRLTDYRGLFYEQPVLAGVLTLFLLSLAGVPLTSGFVAKWVVFGAAIEAGYAWVVVVGAVASTIAAFFYLRLLVVAYMQEPVVAVEPPRVRTLGRSVIGLTAFATIYFGLLWGDLIEVAEKATLIAGR